MWWDVSRINTATLPWDPAPFFRHSPAGFVYSPLLSCQTMTRAESPWTTPPWANLLQADGCFYLQCLSPSRRRTKPFRDVFLQRGMRRRDVSVPNIDRPQKSAGYGILGSWHVWPRDSLTVLKSLSSALPSYSCASPVQVGQGLLHLLSRFFPPRQPSDSASFHDCGPWPTA